MRPSKRRVLARKGAGAEAKSAHVFARRRWIYICMPQYCSYAIGPHLVNQMLLI